MLPSQGRPDVSVNPLFTREPVRIPRDELPLDELDPQVAYQVVHDELMLDGNPRLNLATFVTTWMEQRAAERAVRRLAGVRGVINLLTVRPRIEPSPAELKRRIEEALVRNVETDARRVTVSVDDGKVILTGTVHSWWEKEEAERVAWSAPGVRTVDNRIAVTPIPLAEEED